LSNKKYQLQNALPSVCTVVDIINFQHCLTNEYNLTTIETYQILADMLNMTYTHHLFSTLCGVFYFKRLLSICQKSSLLLLS